MKNRICILYICLFAALILCPLLSVDLREGAVSETENRYLAEFPDLGQCGAEGLSEGVEAYWKDRIGFRRQMIFLYQELSDLLFHEYVGQAYGEDGYTFIVTNHEIEDWQRQNLDYAFAGQAAAYVQSVQRLCESRGIPFYFFIPTSKEEIYGEYFLKTVNRGESEKSRMDLVLEALDILEVPYVFTRERFLSLKREKQLYARKYDPAHWNEHGAFEGAKLLLENLDEAYPDLRLPGIREDQFAVTETEARTQLNSDWIIHDTLPHYERKEARYYEEKLYPDLEYSTYYTRYVNPAAENGKTLLMMHDSYLMGKELFFADNFSEIVFVSNANLWNLPYYLNIFDPDLVVYESVQWGLLHRDFSSPLQSVPFQEKAEPGLKAAVHLKGGLRKIPVFAASFALPESPAPALDALPGSPVFASGFSANREDGRNAELPVPGGLLEDSLMENGEQASFPENEDLLVKIEGEARFLDGREAIALYGSIGGKHYQAAYDAETAAFSLTLPVRALRDSIGGSREGSIDTFTGKASGDGGGAMQEMLFQLVDSGGSFSEGVPVGIDWLMDS